MSLGSGSRLSFSLGGTALSVATAAATSSAAFLTGGLQHDPRYDPIYDKALSTASARVIQPSPDPDPTKTADMTQQQKVAAALMKAGISNPAAWAAAGSHCLSARRRAAPNGALRNPTTPNARSSTAAITTPQTSTRTPQ